MAAPREHPHDRLVEVRGVERSPECRRRESDVMLRCTPLSDVRWGVTKRRKRFPNTWPASRIDELMPASARRPAPITGVVDRRR